MLTRINQGGVSMGTMDTASCLSMKQMGRDRRNSGSTPTATHTYTKQNFD